ncbi:MAG: teichuronic acid biosynthesis glycosyltransferase TuaH [bacterium]
MTGEDLVVVIAGTSWDGVRYSERHVAMHLSERVPVLWVDPQMSVLTPRREPESARSLREDRLRRVAPNILRLTPVTVPGVTRPVLRDIAIRQARRAVRRTVEAIGARVHTTLVASLNDMLDVVPSAQRVFYGTDDFVAGARLMGNDPAWLQQLTDRQLARADVVVATSPVLQEKWSAQRPGVVMIPNGCDAAHFATADEAPLPSDVRLPAPIAGFVGGMSDRIELPLLEAVAATGASLLLVGGCQPTFDVAKLSPLLTRPNVQWVGAKDFDELPSYLRVIDVGLTPYGTSTFNIASFPLKTLEYLAAGRPVVASDLPAHRWLQTSHVTIAQTPQEFAERCRALLGVARSERDVELRKAFGARHSWARRTAEIATVLGIERPPATQSRAA